MRGLTMARTLAGAIVVVVAGFLMIAATQPDTFRVQRSALIQAPPAKVHALLDDFDRWQSWSPYEKKDPAMKRVRSGPASGVGAVYAWESSEVGSGRMEILESSPSGVRIKLDFTAPLEAHNVAEFVLRPEGDATRVTWTMQGPNTYVGKLFQTVFDMDRMVGGDFEAGLASLKSLTEG
jgi:hypothetical protein